MPDPDDLKREAKAKAKRLRDLARKAEAAAGDSAYESHKSRARERQREIAAAGKEIGPIPPVADPARRERCRLSLLDFCRTYFPVRFPWQFSPVHVEAGNRTDRCSFHGGLFALAMQRGGGKTSMAECAVLRNLLYGVRKFVVLVQANEVMAARSMKNIVRQLETNDLLHADFPEVCFPIRALDRIAQRSKGQTVNGKPTLMEWRADGVTLPTVEGSAASGGVIFVSGLTGSIRGLTAPSPDGGTMRPDLVVIDDAQTRETARSPTQTSEREAIITDDILGLSGPGSRMAGLMLCTPIYPNDLSERFLSHDRHPEWQGLRSKMLTAFPTNREWWDRYAALRRESLANGGDGREANELYAAEREIADAGAAVSWPDRMEPGELSAIQCAMNKYLTNPRGFKAEYQCEAEEPAATASAKHFSPVEVVKRLSGLPRFEVPREATRITAFIDPGGGIGRGLWYAVVAWDNHFGGAIIDYGTWPRQSRANFAAEDMRPGLAELYPGLAEPARVYAGLSALAAAVIGRTYQREQGGGDLRISRLIVDAGWHSQAVHQWCRESPYAAVIYPSKGRARTTTASGVGEWKSRPGEQGGYHWRLTISETGRGQMVQFDPDIWKSRAHDALTIPMGTPGRLALYGTESRAHEMIAEHFAAESSEPAMVRGTTFDKWIQRPDKPDNHLLDCVVGCFVAASVSGLALSASGAAPAAPPAPKPHKSLAQKQREKRGGLDADGRPVISWK